MQSLHDKFYFTEGMVMPKKKDVDVIDYSEKYLEWIISLLENMEPWSRLHLERNYYTSIFGENTNHHIKLALIEGSVVGVVAWQIFDNFPFGGYIRVIAIDQNYQGKGIGRILISVAEDKIFQEMKNSFVLVHKSNINAKNFYIRNNYREIGIFTDYIHTGEDLMLLRKTTGPVL